MGPMRSLKLRLFGSFVAEWSDAEPVRVTGMKQRALLAILATAAHGTHTRAWLQETLWSLSGPELGRASLRRALSNLKSIFGEAFDELFVVENIDIGLRADRIEVVGRRGDGEFLQGIQIAEPGFLRWLREMRQHYELGSTELVRPVAKGMRPTVAIIPFLPRTMQPIDVHFSDLLALEVSRALSRSHLIDVISHLSSRQFDPRRLDLETVRRKLGVDYVVYGSLHVDGGRFRLDADFAEAASGRMRWTREFGGRLDDVLHGDDGVVAELSTAIGRSILSASVELAQNRPLPDVESHALFMAAVTHMHQHVLSSFSRARRELEELIRRAPHLSFLHAWLGKWYILQIAQGWSLDVAGDTGKAVDCAARALDIDPQCSFSLAIDGMIQNNARKTFPVASSRFEEAIAINPNNAMAWLLRGRLNAFVGNGPEAVACADRALALSPIDPYAYFYDSLAATAYLADGRYEKSLELADRSLAANPRHTSTLRLRAVTLDLMGREEEARRSVAELMRLEPKLTVRSYLQNHPAADHSTGRTWADALRRSGLPEG